MGRVQAAEAALYSDVWSGLDHYADTAPGQGWAGRFAALTGAEAGATVLDAGAGSGKGALALSAQGFKVAMCDLTPEGLIETAQDLPFQQACLWHDLRPVAFLSNLALGLTLSSDDEMAVDWVFCCDVMEHLPKEFTLLSIANMLAIARHGVFLSITFVPDNFGVMVGKPLHQTVESFVWWKERLAEIGHVVEARDCLASGVFVVEPRS